MEPDSGFAELMAGVRSAPGGLEAFAHTELGVKVAASFDAFAFGEASLMPGLVPSWQAGIGARVNW